MHGDFGEDVVYGGDGDDWPLYGDEDEDVIHGGDGNDYIASFEFYHEHRDIVTCGKGKDYVDTGPEDSIAPDCERVRVIYWWMHY